MGDGGLIDGTDVGGAVKAAAAAAAEEEDDVRRLCVG